MSFWQKVANLAGVPDEVDEAESDARAGVAGGQGLPGSAEDRHFVQAMYQGLLWRDADENGFKDAVNALVQGETYIEALANMVSSSEFISKHSSRHGLVRKPLRLPGDRSYFLPELLHWARRDTLSPDMLRERLAHLNSSNPQIFVFRIEGKDVHLVAKDGPVNPMYVQRTDAYLRLLRTALSRNPLAGSLELGFCAADADLENPDFPLFSFQKPSRSHNFLLPDVDFLVSWFYHGAEYNGTDPVYHEKQNKAIFVGATTGAPGIVITQKLLDEGKVPRIASALAFQQDEDIEFHLPVIVQCDGPETVQRLKDLGFGDGRRVGREEQLRCKFMLSMDGNGATCSRVALALKSNSVLMKYESDSQLYYFRKMLPWQHYVPVASDEDVRAVIALEQRFPGAFEPIAQAGAEFYRQELTEEAVMRYTANLLQAYQSLYFGGLPENQVPAEQ